MCGRSIRQSVLWVVYTTGFMGGLAAATAWHPVGNHASDDLSCVDDSNSSDKILEGAHRRGSAVYLATLGVGYAICHGTE